MIKHANELNLHDLLNVSNNIWVAGLSKRPIKLLVVWMKIENLNINF